ncbi:MAG: hypothetical protein PHH70_03890 [Candidatus Gracilibacteria bacterium]|nr:hypothetical protein [Candidatus Gracilibacteria bacterium]
MLDLFIRKNLFKKNPENTTIERLRTRLEDVTTESVRTGFLDRITKIENDIIGHGKGGAECATASPSILVSLAMAEADNPFLSIREKRRKFERLTSKGSCDCLNCRNRMKIQLGMVLAERITSLQTEIEQQIKREERNRNRQKDTNPVTPSHRSIVYTTSETGGQETVKITIGKLQARLDNIVSGRGKMGVGEMENMQKSIDALSGASPDIQIIRAKFQQAVALVTNPPPSNNVPAQKSSGETSIPQGSVIELPVTLPENVRKAIAEAEATFERFKKHIDVISSTNHTGTGSKGDGTFWKHGLLPILNFTINRIRDGKINPREFSWSEVMDLHKKTVDGKIRRDVLSLQEVMTHNSQRGSFVDNIKNLMPVLNELATSSGRFLHIRRKGHTPIRVLREYVGAFRM